MGFGISDPELGASFNHLKPMGLFLLVKSLFDALKGHKSLTQTLCSSNKMIFIELIGFTRNVIFLSEVFIALKRTHK